MQSISLPSGQQIVTGTPVYAKENGFDFVVTLPQTHGLWYVIFYFVGKNDQ